jgi:hypothetical protein
MTEQQLEALNCCRDIADKAENVLMEARRLKKALDGNAYFDVEIRGMNFEPIKVPFEDRATREALVDTYLEQCTERYDKTVDEYERMLDSFQMAAE